MATLLIPADIADITPDLDNDQRQAIIEEAVALAGHYAPCLRADAVAPEVAAVAKAVIKKAISYDLQAAEQGVLTRQHEQIGAYAVTNFAHRSGTLYSPTQIELLRSLCAGGLPGVYSLPLEMPDTLAGW